MFDITNTTTGDIVENQTIEQVVDYLNEEGALVEDETLRGEFTRAYKNEQWLQIYTVEYTGVEDADEAFEELSDAI